MKYRILAFIVMFFSLLGILQAENSSELKSNSFWKALIQGDQDSIQKHLLFFKKTPRKILLQQLVLNAQRETSPVAVYFGKSGIKLFVDQQRRAKDKSSLTEEIEFKKRQEGIAAIFEDIGLSFSKIDKSWLEKGNLQKSAVKVVLLSTVDSLSIKEVESLKKFTEEGGLVVADCFTGMPSANKKDQKKNLDSFFGIKHGGLSYKSVYSPLLVSDLPSFFKFSKPNSEIHLGVTESNISLDTGNALGQIHGIPAVVVKKHAKGHSVYLNLELSDYLKIRSSDEKARQVMSLFGQLFKKAGVKGDVFVIKDKKPAPGYRVAKFNSGCLQYIAIQYTGKYIGDTSDTLLAIAPALLKNKFVYDVVSGKLLKKAPAFALTYSGTSALICLVEKQSEALLLSCPDSVYKGKSFSASLLVDSRQPEAKKGIHMITGEILGKKGIYVEKTFKYNFLKDNKAKLEMSFPEKLSPGKYTLRVKIYPSGKIVTKEIQVLGSPKNVNTDW